MGDPDEGAVTLDELCHKLNSLSNMMIQELAEVVEIN
jgi:hypothetical protein